MSRGQSDLCNSSVEASQMTIQFVRLTIRANHRGSEMLRPSLYTGNHPVFTLK